MIPSRSSSASGPDPSITSVEQMDGGLPALGAAYAGEFEAVLGAFSVAAGPANARLSGAQDLAAQCADFAAEAHPSDTRQAAWIFLQKCVARA